LGVIADAVEEAVPHEVLRLRVVSLKVPEDMPMTREGKGGNLTKRSLRYAACGNLRRMPEVRSPEVKRHGTPSPAQAGYDGPRLHVVLTLKTAGIPLFPALNPDPNPQPPWAPFDAARARR